MAPTVSDIVCAMDGGGTACRAVICDGAGTVLGRAEGGPCNVTTDFDAAVDNLRRCVTMAAASAGIERDVMARCVVHAGVAGVMCEPDAARVAAALAGMFDAPNTARRIVVTDDRATAVEGALGPRDGAVVSVGTGSFIACRRQGRVTLQGGWGFLLGDQASGAWLGRAAMEQALLAQDGLVTGTDLTAAILSRFGGPLGMVAFARTASGRDFAGLAPDIVAAAQAGDAAGQALMRRGAAHLDAGLRALGIGGTDTICLTGGLGPSYVDLLDPVFRPRLRPARGHALDGACALALRNLAALRAGSVA